MALPPLRATISMTTWSSLTCRTSGNRFSRALLMLTAVISASLRLVQESCTSVRHRGRGRQGGRPSTSYSAEMPEPLCRSRCAGAAVPEPLCRSGCTMRTCRHHLAPSWLEAFTAAERPDLWSLARDGRLFDGLWPEYNHHGNHTGRYFGSVHPPPA